MRLAMNGRRDGHEGGHGPKSRRKPVPGTAAREVAVGIRVVVGIPVAGALVAWGCGGAMPAQPPSVTPRPPPVATPAPRASEAPPGPSQAVESFLDAAARRDLAQMAGSFGTADGPVAHTGGALGCALRKLGSWVGLGEACPRWADMELRMDLLATVLNPAAYRVRAEEPVAGRERPTVRVLVDVTVGGREAPEVPFVVVLARNGSWLVQEIGVEHLTR